MNSSARMEEERVRGICWWNEHFGDDVTASIPFTTLFFPKLVHYCRQKLPSNESFSIEKLTIIAKYGIAHSTWQHNTISQQDFLHFLGRFGPLESSLVKLIECFTIHRELVTWFHGTLSRNEAESLLMAPSHSDGSFLVRFSESHPCKFTLSYVKVSSSTQKREIRNVLIQNLGQNGYTLPDSQNKVYPSIQSFIQRSARRLSHGIASALAHRCNQELAAVRARQDLVTNSYTSFSTESIDTSSPVARNQDIASHVLFSRSPEHVPTQQSHDSSSNNSTSSWGDSYSAFTMENMMLPPPLKLQTSRALASNEEYGAFPSVSVLPPSNNNALSSTSSNRPLLDNQVMHQNMTTDNDYGDFSSFLTSGGDHGPISNQVEDGLNDAYGTFDALYSKEDQVKDPQKTRPVYPSVVKSAPSVDNQSICIALDALNTGMELYQQKQLDEALLCFNRARELAQKTQDQVVQARALGNMGTVYLDNQNAFQAVQCYEQCLDITRSINDTKRERTILNNLVLALVASNEFERAYTYSQIQLETTVSEINRRKILSRMSLLREKAARHNVDKIR